MNRQQTQIVANVMITAVAAIVVIPIIYVVVYTVARGIGAINWEFLTQFPRNGMTEGGIFPAIVGTILLTFGTAITAIPLGKLIFFAVR